MTGSYSDQLNRLRKAINKKDSLIAERQLHLLEKELHIRIMKNLKEQREYLILIKELLESERNRYKMRLKSYLKNN